MAQYEINLAKGIYKLWITLKLVFEYIFFQPLLQFFSGDFGIFWGE